MEKTYTQIVSEYLAGLKYEDIPQAFPPYCGAYEGPGAAH